jgi:hypothetical protein
MLINRDEMIEEFEQQIRKFGGAWSEWCVGTAKDARGPFSPIQGIGARSGGISLPIWATAWPVRTVTSDK